MSNTVQAEKTSNGNGRSMSQTSHLVGVTLDGRTATWT